MPSPDNRAVLRKHLLRLDQHIEHLQTFNSRFSWLRLGILVSGALAIWVAYSRLGAAVECRAAVGFSGRFPCSSLPFKRCSDPTGLAEGNVRAGSTGFSG